MTGAVLRSSPSRIAKGMRVAFTYNVATRELVAQWDPPPAPRSLPSRVLRRYRAARDTFAYSVAAAIGERVAIVDLERNGYRVRAIDPPAGGRA
jgi:hypothetical protein